MNPEKVLLTVFACCLFFTIVHAAPSPWDSWRSGYTNFERGETLRERGSYIEALGYFEKARKNYLAVRSARPDWNQRVIADRLRDCDRQISELKRLLGEGGSQTRKAAGEENGKAAGEENGKAAPAPVVQTVTERKVENVPVRPAAAIPSANAALDELRRENAALKLANAKLTKDLQSQRNFETEMAALLRDRKVLEDKYALLDRRYKNLEAELKRPEERIAALEKRLLEERMGGERLQKQISAMEQQLRIEKENSRLNLAAKNALEDIVSKRNEELQRLRQEIAAAGEKLNAHNDLNEKINELNRKISSLDKEVADKDRQIEVLSRRAETGQNREDSEEKSRAAENLKNQLKAVQNTNQLLEKRIAAVIVERDEANLASRNLKKENSTLLARVQNLQDNLEQEKSSSKLVAVELSGLRERNRTLENDVKQLYDRSVELDKRLALRNSADFQAAAEARKSMKKLENDLLAAQNELIRLRAEADERKNALEASERKLKAVSDENLKSRSEVVAALEKEKTLHLELSKLQKLQGEYEELQRNFKALSAENRENRLLLEAAKPRQAELERAKLRMVENDQLKSALAKEQQLNAELKSAFNREQEELQQLRKKSAEFDASRRRMVELEALARETAHLRNLEKELSVLREREVELAALKVKFSEAETQLRSGNVKLTVLNDKISKLENEAAALRQDNSELQKLRRTNGELEALVNSQTAELDKLNKQLLSFIRKEAQDVHVACRIEAEKLRRAATAIGPLNDRIQQLQGQLQSVKKQTAELDTRNRELMRDGKNKDSEIAQLKKLNSDLAALQEKSAAGLLEKVDASRMSRLENELEELNKLNAELAAERDRLQAMVSNVGNDGDETQNKISGISSRSPEELTATGFIAEKEGKYELALWHYRQAVAVKKDFTAGHYHLGMLYFRRSNFKEAVPHLEKALAASPDDVRLALDTARSLIEISRFGNAKTIVDPLLKKFPDNAYVQMCAGLIDAGCGAPARAEEKLLTAARLAPDSAIIRIELARLLASSITNRDREAVLAYEKARELGAAPEPALEKKLGSMLDHRREMIRFMGGAAREAEMNKDWLSAVWYYKKMIEENHPAVIPMLAFAQWKSGNVAAAKETLEFNQPSRNSMAVRALIAIGEKDNQNAVRFAQQSAGAKIPKEWFGINLELENLRKLKKPTPAVKILLKSVDTAAQ
ncbi:MAG: tetratricopeptide repeat protein [Lentisphaerae bacterium]|nr:tetratricopeptide repeat protein [Lentisphaerota bacterium]